MLSVYDQFLINFNFLQKINRELGEIIFVKNVIQCSTHVPSFQMINIIDHLLSSPNFIDSFIIYHISSQLTPPPPSTSSEREPSYLGVSPGLAVRVGPVPGRFPLSGPLHDYRWRLRDDGRITLVGDDHGLVGSCAL